MENKISPIAIQIQGISIRAGTKEKEVHIISGFRTDLLSVYQLIKSHRFAGFGSNYIGLQDWTKFISVASQLPLVTISYKGDSYEQILLETIKPSWAIELSDKFIKIIPGVDYNQWDIRGIPGLYYEYTKNYYKIPLSEGWRLFAKLQNVENVQYSIEASTFILEQIESRKNVDEIATAKDWIYDITFTDPLVKLRPYQRVAAAFIEAVGNKALLSLDMGLGKTIVSLAITQKHNYRTLVICPASLKPKWAKEIKRLTGSPPILLMGSRPEKWDMMELLVNKRSQYYLCNYETLSGSKYLDDNKEIDFAWVKLINMAKLDMIIIDESHYGKNTDSARAQAKSRLISPGIIELTGTPVINRPGEYFPTLHLLRPDTFPSEQSFLDQYTYDGKQPKNSADLQDALKTIMIRRRKSDVIDDIPDKNIIPQYHILSSKALEIYKRIEPEIMDMVDDDSGKVSITRTLGMIQKLKWICAIDKVNSTADLAVELHDSATDSGERHNKILIFSQFKNTTYNIARRLGNEALSFVSANHGNLITAGINERFRLVEQFQNDPKIKFICVTEKTATEGLDITEAGYVIHNDLFWSPAKHDQADDRAYMRINDPHGIDSYYRITDMDGESIDEWIWELLDMKAGIINEVVDGVERSRDVSIAAALIAKFKEKSNSFNFNVRRGKK